MQWDDGGRLGTEGSRRLPKCHGWQDRYRSPKCFEKWSTEEEVSGFSIDTPKLYLQLTPATRVMTTPRAGRARKTCQPPTRVIGERGNVSGDGSQAGSAQQGFHGSPAPSRMLPFPRKAGTALATSEQQCDRLNIVQPSPNKSLGTRPLPTPGLPSDAQSLQLGHADLAGCCRPKGPPRGQGRWERIPAQWLRCLAGARARCSALTFKGDCKGLSVYSGVLLEGGVASGPSFARRRRSPPAAALPELFINCGALTPKAGSGAPLAQTGLAAAGEPGPRGRCRLRGRLPRGCLPCRHEAPSAPRLGKGLCRALL